MFGIKKNRKEKKKTPLEMDQELINRHLSSYTSSKMLLITLNGTSFNISEYEGGGLYTAQFEWFEKGFLGVPLRKITVKSITGEYAGSITESPAKYPLFGKNQQAYFVIDIFGKQVGHVYSDHMDYLGLWYGHDVIEGKTFDCDDTVYSANNKVIGKIIIRSCKARAGMIWSKYSQNNLVLTLLALSKMITWWYMDLGD